MATETESPLPPVGPASANRPSSSATSVDEAERVIQRAAATVRAARLADPGPERLAVPPGLPDRLRQLARSASGGPPPGDYMAVRQDRETRDRVERLVKESGVPARYAAACPDDLSAVPAAEAGAYAQKLERLRSLVPGPCIVAVVGPRGTGKTWMACALVNATCRAGRRAKYADATDYFLQLKATYGPTAKEDQTAVEARYLAPAVLVLDEMHERGDTAWEDRMLTRLVNKRYAGCKSTVLVSNDDPAGFAARVGASIADRINDAGGLIVCQWQSLRGRIGGCDDEG